MGAPVCFGRLAFPAVTLATSATEFAVAPRLRPIPTCPPGGRPPRRRIPCSTRRQSVSARLCVLPHSDRTYHSEKTSCQGYRCVCESHHLSAQSHATERYQSYGPGPFGANRPGGNQEGLMMKLTQFGYSKISPDSLLCVTRVHNEGHIVEDFIQHHRKLGNVSFLIIDNHSTDDTSRFLMQQPDVTLFHPTKDSHYREDKKLWVQELLNRFCSNRWALCLDADEQLIYQDMEHRDIRDLIGLLERRNADSFPAVMLDMYADKPLAEHFFSGGNLKRSFPYFDDLSTYRVMYKRQLKLFHARGGMRFRLFARVRKRLVQPGLPLRFNERQNRLFVETKRKIDRISRIVSDPFFGRSGYLPNSLKVPLIFWRTEMKWDEHYIKETKRQSIEMGALLHFKMAKGIAGIEYLAGRNQHAGNSLYARWILSTENLGDINPYLFCFETIYGQ